MISLDKLKELKEIEAEAKKLKRRKDKIESEIKNEILKTDSYSKELIDGRVARLTLKKRFCHEPCDRYVQLENEIAFLEAEISYENMSVIRDLQIKKQEIDNSLRAIYNTEEILKRKMELSTLKQAQKNLSEKQYTLKICKK